MTKNALPPDSPKLRQKKRRTGAQRMTHAVYQARVKNGAAPHRLTTLMRLHRLAREMQRP